MHAAPAARFAGGLSRPFAQHQAGATHLDLSFSFRQHAPGCARGTAAEHDRERALPKDTATGTGHWPLTLAMCLSPGLVAHDCARLPKTGCQRLELRRMSLIR